MSSDMELLAVSCLVFLCKLRWVGERVGIVIDRKERKGKVGAFLNPLSVLLRPWTHLALLKSIHSRLVSVRRQSLHSLDALIASCKHFVYVRTKMSHVTDIATWIWNHTNQNQ